MTVMRPLPRGSGMLKTCRTKGPRPRSSSGNRRRKKMRSRRKGGGRRRSNAAMRTCKEEGTPLCGWGLVEGKGGKKGNWRWEIANIDRRTVCRNGGPSRLRAFSEEGDIAAVVSGIKGGDLSVPTQERALWMGHYYFRHLFKLARVPPNPEKNVCQVLRGNTTQINYLNIVSTSRKYSRLLKPLYTGLPAFATLRELSLIFVRYYWVISGWNYF